MGIQWSKDYFSIARDAAVSLRDVDERLQRMYDAMTLSAQKYTQSRVSDVDPQAAIDAYIDAERAAESIRARLAGILEDATNLLYGYHARAGVAKLLSSKHADVICMRWLQLRTWLAISRDLGCSIRWCKQLESQAFAFMDDYGESALREFNDIESDYFEAMKGDMDE